MLFRVSGGLVYIKSAFTCVCACVGPRESAACVGENVECVVVDGCCYCTIKWLL